MYPACLLSLEVDSSNVEPVVLAYKKLGTMPPAKYSMLLFNITSCKSKQSNIITYSYIII